MQRILLFLFLISLFTIHYSLSPSVCEGRKLCLFTHEAKAAGEFSISYDNVYEVDQNFNFNVRQNVKITNLTTQYYAAEFTISIGNVKIEAVSAVDESGPIVADVSFTGRETSIKLKFTTPAVGKGQTKNFSLNYKAPELINKTGQILEVSIPKLATGVDIDQFNVTLLVPTAAGPAAFISPEPKSTQPAGFSGENQYFFDKSQLIKSGISASFGEKQIFSFTLIYHLLNPKSAKTEIALPPDNPYQKVLITQIDPAPIDVRIDSDGNWMALFEVDSGRQKDVKVTGAVEVYPKPKFKIGKVDNLEKYLQPQQYWEVNENYFKEKAKDLKTPKQIYDFVTSFLSYNQERLTTAKVERLGALGITKNPKNAVCMEFTDLFITIARSAGIPAREVNGFAVSSNERLRPLSLRNFGGDILHAWPEYWDDNTQNWIQIDPTWGATSGGLDYFSKMDFAHVAFVHKGQSSTYPVPAGGYKTDLGQSGDVKVEVATQLPTATFQPRMSIDIPKNLLSGVTADGEIIIKNLSNQALTLGPLKLSTTNLILKTPTEVSVGVLPPAASREIKFEVGSTGLLTNKKGEIKATLGPVVATSAVQIRPSLFFILIVILGGVVIFTGVAFSSIFLFKRILKKPQV